MADKCQTYKALIEEGAGRAAAPSAALGAHLELCAACRGFAREREALVGLLGGLACVPAPNDFEFRLRARMARRIGTEGGRLRRFRPAPGLAAAGLAVCLLAASALYFRAQPSAEDSTAAHIAALPAPVVVVDQRAEATPAGDGRRVDVPAAAQTVRATKTAASRNSSKPRRATRENSFGVRPAPVISGGEVASHAASQGVALRTPTETLRVVLRDERGDAYVVPMRSVSFGAQGPVSRGARASHADKEGVW